MSGHGTLIQAAVATLKAAAAAERDFTATGADAARAEAFDAYTHGRQQLLEAAAAASAAAMAANLQKKAEAVLRKRGGCCYRCRYSRFA